MIVNYNGTAYMFYKDDKLINVLYDHEIKHIVKNPESMEDVKFRNMNICFPSVLGAISLIDVHKVAHREFKHWLATAIMEEQQRQINELANIVRRIQLERITF